jgi:hypothetical protein
MLLIFFLQLSCKSAFVLRGSNIGGLPLYKGRVFPVQAKKAYRGGVQLWLHSFLTSALDGREWVTSRLGHCNPGKNPGTHLTGGGVGPTAGLHVLENSKSVAASKIRTPNHPAASLVTVPTLLP